MRNKRIQSRKFAAGTFIGGMEGIGEQYQLFREHHPHSPVFPIFTTSSAAKHLFDRVLERQEFQWDDSELIRMLLESRRYPKLIREILKKVDSSASNSPGDPSDRS